MPYIVNLSSIHTLLPIHNGVNAFAELCNKYSKDCCANYFPALFSRMTNQAWVGWQYWKNLDSLINPYKLGNLDTKEFLGGLLTIFSFLEEDTVNYPESLSSSLLAEKLQYFSLANLPNETTSLSNQQVALALLEDAWNDIIVVDDACKAKFQQLLELKDDIYLVSNTNELNVDKVLKFLQQNFSNLNLNWKQLSTTDINNQNDSNILISETPKIYLCVSYRYKAFKTA